MGSSRHPDEPLGRVDTTRMAARDGHFMPVSLLDSQFATLQEPTADEPHIRVDISGTPSAVVDAIVAGLAALSRPDGRG